MGGDEYCPLFETKKGKGRLMQRAFAISVSVAICLIWVYRLYHIAQKEIGQDESFWVWIGLLAAELWFSFYWILRQACRWNPIYRQTLKNRLSQRYMVYASPYVDPFFKHVFLDGQSLLRYEKRLPRVDVFVCTADPEIEPPTMVINTVLSVMAYDYPTEKLSVYLSDDAASDITFYALLEASEFAKHWLPFCKRFNVEPRSPSAYFKSIAPTSSDDYGQAEELVAIKKLYEDMERRIENAAKLGRVPEEIHSEHNAFSQWDSYSSRRDHDTILQILLHRKAMISKDVEGCALPTLVYLAREKRPNYPHNFKAGAMNSLLRVSSKISNGEIILNVDCDMYSNNSQSIRDALCFFMDEEKGHDFAFVQYPQNFENIALNDLYGSALLVDYELEFHGADGYGGPLYIGTGCFHRRDILCGNKFNKKVDQESENKFEQMTEVSMYEQSEESKALASCTFEENTAWGKELGLLYGCLVEDVITGLSIQCKGWKSVYYNPTRKAFLGLAPTTLLQVLVQHKRWAEGEFQIFFSKYSAWHSYGKISVGLQMVYCYYNLWASNCLATLYYSTIPSLYLLKGTSLFPQISSPWMMPFAYVIVGEMTYSLFEFLWCGGTIQGWWNNLRIWLYKRTSSYLFAFIDTLLKLYGISDSTFIISAKTTDEDVSQRFEKEVMEFGAASPMFTLLATLALLNLFCFLGFLKEAMLSENGLIRVCENMMLQVVLSGFLVLINLPLYQGLFLRKDKGRLPTSLTLMSVGLALFVCVLFKVWP